MNIRHTFVSTLLAAAILSGSALAASPSAAPQKPDAKVQKTLTAMGSASTWGHPDLFGEFAGMRHFAKGDYKGAMKYFKYGARYADKLSQLSIGLMYENGNGVAKDPVTACAWLAMAAERKFPSFIATRDRVCKALTPAQHDQAVAVLDKLMPVYGDAVAKKRMARALQIARTQMTGSRLGFDSGVIQASASQDCGGPTVSTAGISVPKAGCGDAKFYDPSRWDPKQYFAARDARWRGVVTVGPLQQEAEARTKAASQPASASSAPAGESDPAH